MTDSRNQWDGGGAPLVPASPLVATFDAELGQIFLRMRTLLGLTLWDMARAVGGEPTVIADLEAGALGALPPWPELTRLIHAYAALTGVDASPILNRILRSQGQFALPPPQIDYGQSTGRDNGWHAPVPHQLRGPVYDDTPVPARPQYRALPPPAARDITPPVPAKARPTTVTARTVQAAPSQLPIQPQTAATEKLPRANALKKSGVSVLRGMGRFAVRRAGFIAIFLLLPVMFVVTARSMPNVLYAAISPFPGVVRMPLRASVDGVVALVAPTKDGLTWIDVGDPQIRKADKLPERGR